MHSTMDTPRTPRPVAGLNRGLIIGIWNYMFTYARLSMNIKDQGFPLGDGALGNLQLHGVPPHPFICGPILPKNRLAKFAAIGCFLT